MVQFESLFPGSVLEKMKFSDLVSDSNLSLHSTKIARQCLDI